MTRQENTRTIDRRASALAVTWPGYAVSFEPHARPSRSVVVLPQRWIGTRASTPASSPQTRTARPLVQEALASVRRLSVNPPSSAGAVEAQASSQRFAAALVIVAVATAIVAKLFHLGLAAAVLELWGAEDIVSGISGLPVAARVCVPALGGLLAGALCLLSGRFGEARGMSDLMQAVVWGRVRLPALATLLKAAACTVALACGVSVGRDGPIIQLSGAAAQLVSERLGLSHRQMQRLVAASAAAGFAAAYNTPFAAIMFVVEVIAGVAVLEATIPAAVAVAISSVISELHASAPRYRASEAHVGSPLELLAVMGLALVSAVAMQGFVRMLASCERVCSHAQLGLPLRAALGGLATGAIAAFIPAVCGSGHHQLVQLLGGTFTPGFALILVLGKCLSTSVSTTSGIPGGVFSPTLLLGGGIGFVYASLLGQVAPLGACSTYVLFGMATAVAGTIHAPLMATILTCELSGNYALAMPLLLATGVASLVSRKLRRESLYTSELKRRGVPWELTLSGRRAG